MESAVTSAPGAALLQVKIGRVCTFLNHRDQGTRFGVRVLRGNRVGQLGKAFLFDLFHELIGVHRLSADDMNSAVDTVRAMM